jgi:hypothetical protein
MRGLNMPFTFQRTKQRDYPLQSKELKDARLVVNNDPRKAAKWSIDRLTAKI